MLSATIKHLSLADTVRDLASHEEYQTEEFTLLRDIMSEVYKRLYAMLRQLQVGVLGLVSEKENLSLEMSKLGYQYHHGNHFGNILPFLPWLSMLRTRLNLTKLYS